MSKKKATKPWLGWNLGERRTFPRSIASSQKKSRRFQKSLKRRAFVNDLIEKGIMK